MSPGPGEATRDESDLGAGDEVRDGGSDDEPSLEEARLLDLAAGTGRCHLRRMLRR